MLFCLRTIERVVTNDFQHQEDAKSSQRLHRFIMSKTKRNSVFSRMKPVDIQSNKRASNAQDKRLLRDTNVDRLEKKHNFKIFLRIYIFIVLPAIARFVSDLILNLIFFAA